MNKNTHTTWTLETWNNQVHFGTAHSHKNKTAARQFARGMRKTLKPGIRIFVGRTVILSDGSVILEPEAK